MTNPLQSLKEFVGLVVERKMREADVSDGSRVKHGSPKHIKDLEKRIAGLVMWRDKQRRGSEARANYSRLISRLKGELSSARRHAEKSNLKENYATDPDPEQLAKWEKLDKAQTPDSFANHVVQSFHAATSMEELDKARNEVSQKRAAGSLSSALSEDFIGWLYDRCASKLGVSVRKLR